MNPIQPALVKPDSKPLNTAPKLDSRQVDPKNKQPASDSNRYTYLLKIKLGELEFSNLKGDILGAPLILLSTRQHSQIDFIVNDQSGELWTKVLKQEGAEVSVDLGYPPDAVETILTGKAYRIGRKLPDGITIEVVDEGFSLSGATGSTAQSSTEPPPNPALKAVLTDIDQKNNLKLNQTALALKDLFGSQSPNQLIPDPPKEVQKTPQQQAAAAGVAKLDSAAKSATNNKQPAPQLEKTAVTGGLSFEKQSAAATGQQGNVSISTPAMKSATDDAAKRGEVIVQEGNTVKQVGAGQGEPSGVVLDYKQNKACFIRCSVSKKTPVQLQSGYGAVSVQGWNVNDKQGVGATAVTQSPISVHPTGVIQAPEWGKVKLSDPIFPGCLYTWGDATRNGERVPEGKSVMQGIVAISQTLMQFQQKGINGGKKFEITSWYRDPATNIAQSRSGAAGPHTTGSAVDFWFPGKGLVDLFKQLESSHQGGVAAHPDIYGGTSGFCHIDLITSPPRRRWSY